MCCNTHDPVLGHCLKGGWTGEIVLGKLSRGNVLRVLSYYPLILLFIMPKCTLVAGVLSNRHASNMRIWRKTLRKVFRGSCLGGNVLRVLSYYPMILPFIMSNCTLFAGVPSCRDASIVRRHGALHAVWSPGHYYDHEHVCPHIHVCVLPNGRPRAELQVDS